MNNFTKIIFVTATTALMTACAPMNKESYLEKYDTFSTKISENYKSYTDEDWQKMTAKYDKFSGEWYEKFKNELSLKDEIAIKANQAKWYYYRNLNDVTSTVKQLLESLDIEGMKEQAQYYIDNDMASDLQKFYNDAVKAGIETEKAVREILKELGINIDELQR